MIAVCSVLALFLAALSLGPSFAHVLEAPPRMREWPQQLWVDATVFHAQFKYFAVVGGSIDVLAILGAGALAFLVRGQPGFAWAMAAFVLLLLAMCAWIAIVAPTNSVLASWLAGAEQTDFKATRDRWEFGHMAVAALKASGFVALALCVTHTKST
jgi:hypothetical protein